MAVGRSSDYSSQNPQIWADDLYSEAENLTFWSSKVGAPGSSMPIVRRDELEKEAGDTIKIDIALALDGGGISGDTSSLEGNEEKLKLRQTSVAVRQFAHAVRRTEQTDVFNVHNLRTTSLNQLRKWLAGYLDDDIFAELTGNTKRDGTTGTTVPDSAKWAAGSASSRATVADGDATGRLTLATITELKAYFQTEIKIEPIMMDGGDEYFMLVAHPYAVMQLKRYDTNWAQAQREAGVRGADNPLFTGAAGLWDGVIIYSSNRVPRSTNGSINVADNVFAGAQALSLGWAMTPDWREEEFDYGREFGVATVGIKGEKLNVFDLTSAGGAAASALTSIGAGVVYTAAVSPSQP